MADSKVVTVNPSPPQPSSIAPLAAANFPVGTVVWLTFNLIAESGLAAKAKADNVDTALAIGLAKTQGVNGDRVLVQYRDSLILTTAQWDAVTGGSGGLLIGSPYYLSAATAGGLTATAPIGGGQFVTPVGVALSSTELMIRPEFPVAV